MISSIFGWSGREDNTNHIRYDMNSRRLFSTKAEIYEKYRWRYTPQAIQTILTMTEIDSRRSIVADIGAGTGILAREFIGKANKIYLVEPENEMRTVAEHVLGAEPSYAFNAGCAETTKLPIASIDVITVGQAIHWFDGQAARKEFRRILKPGGWFAILRNYGTDKTLNADLEKTMELFSSSNPARPEIEAASIPAEEYFDGGRFEKFTFPFSLLLDWEDFLGAIKTTSFFPDEDLPGYNSLVKAIRRIFDKYGQDDRLIVHGETELYLGQPNQACCTT